ncbi:hypothetical protein AAG570_006962 [Ranatra chinensis]|uniref:Pre-C2HC domain-containing protein n=1 Tax=Ranatra chinensis TaxID=642074 RepID=A0ABD0YVK7_9HEMI
MNNNERADTVCSTGEFDEDETPFVEQLKRRKKRTKPLDSPPPTKKTLVDNIQSEPTNPTSNIHKPPPIFLKYNCTSNYIQLCKDIQENIQPATFKTKSGPKHLIILTDTPDGYRAAVKYLRNVKIEFHTFQPKEEKPFRVVIRGLHHTVPVELIKIELEELGFKIRNVSNVIINRHGTKIPRPLFFVDLEANENNQNIFEVRSIMLGIVSVEEPYKKTEIPQCQNCQQYGHTKGYCNYGPKCSPRHPGKRLSPEVKTLLSAFLLCQQTPLVYNTSNIPRNLSQPNPCYNKKTFHRNSNRNNYLSNHSGDLNARTKILTRILSCFHNRNHAQGFYINSNSNISKPSLILSNVNDQFNNFDQAFNMPNNTKRGLSNNCLHYASSSTDHNQIPKFYLLI